MSTPTLPTRTRRRGVLRVLAAAAAAVVAAAGFVAIAVPAAATPGYTGDVVGTVEIQLPGGTSRPAALDEVSITAYLLDDDGEGATTQPEWTTVTDENGDYSLGELPVGDWAFEASYRGSETTYVGGFGTGQVALTEVLLDGDFRTLAEGATDGDSFYILSGAIMSGHVTNTADAPLVGQPVELWRYSSLANAWELFAETTTNATGDYLFTSLPTSYYAVRAGGASGYAAEFWDPSGEEYVSEPGAWIWSYLSAGFIPGEETVKDFELLAAGRISGTVKNTSGSLLGGIVVTPYRENTSGYLEPWGSGVTTSSKGTYSITALPPGDYTVAFASSEFASTQYTDQFWSNKPDVWAATQFTLAPGGSKASVNATLARTGVISGTISLAGGGFPASDDIEISACDFGNWGFYGCVQSGAINTEGDPSYNEATGAYTIAPLEAGKYIVMVRYLGDLNFQTEWWGSNAHEPDAATPITLAKGASVTGRNLQLDPGATFEGSAALLGAPLEGLDIDIYPEMDVEHYESYAPDYSVTTASDGTFSVTGIAAGEYVLRAAGSPEDTAPRFYGGASVQDAEVVSAVGTATVGGLDFEMEEGASIVGTVTGAEPGGEPLSASVRIESVSTGDFSYDEVSTDGAGEFRFDSLPAGDYRVVASESYWETGGDIHLEGYAGLPGATRSEATIFSVGAGDSADADILLDLGGIYTGRFLDSDGVPLDDNIYVSNQDLNGRQQSTMVDLDGTFRLTGLGSGAHTLQIEAPEGFATNVRFGAPATTINAEPVELGNIEVERESTISGVVVGIDGRAVRGVRVTPLVRNPAGYMEQVGPWDPVFTDSSGRFTVTGLATDAVYLYFSPSGGAYPAQYLGGGLDWAFSEPVVLAQEGTTAFREVRLLSGGVIKGVVKNPVTGRTVSGIGVSASPISDPDGSGSYAYGQTNSSGVYSLPGLLPDSYTVSFNNYGTSPGMTYGTASRDVFVPDRTTVTVNASLTPGYKVSGVVRDADGLPMPDVKVTATPEGLGEDFVWTVWTDEKGAYEFVLLQGKWLLSFQDDEGRAGSVYYGGTAAATPASWITVGTRAITGRNVTMPDATGGIDVEAIFGDADPNPTGYVVLERMEEGVAVSRQHLREEWFEYPLWKAFPIRGLADGTYRVTVVALSDGGDVGGVYSPAVVDDIEVTGGAITTIPVIDLGTPDLLASGDVPESVDPPIVISDGTPQVGEGLEADPGTWSTPVSSFGYQWLRDGKTIPGATGPTYDLAPGDGGREISVQVLAYVDHPYFSYSWWGTAVAVLGDEVAVGAAAVQLTPASIAGSFVAGQTLTANPGTFDLPGLTFGYTWFRDGSPIVGATAKTYKLTTADVGAEILLLVEVSRPGFETSYVNSEPHIEVLPAVALKQTIASKVTAITDGWSVTPGTWTPTPTAFTYVWRVYEVDGTDYVGYDTADVPQLVDAGIKAGTARVTVAITATRAGYTTTTVEVPVRSGPAPTFDVPPVLVGTPQVGFPLTVDVTGAATTPETATYTYQWYKGASAILGAKAATYTPTTADVGATLKVRVALKAAGYTAPSTPQLELTAAATVLAAGVFTSGVPTIEGMPAVGRRLTVDPGVWSPVATFAYQWRRDGVAITGATTSSYVLKTSDLGTEITVSVRGTRTGYVPVTALSDSVEPTEVELLSVTAPSLPAVARVGAKLTAAVGTWDLAPTSYRYQWYVNGLPVVGATASTFTPRVTDLGEDVSVGVIARRTGFVDSAQEFSHEVTVLEGAAFTASRAPALTVGGVTVSSVKIGRTIATTAGTWPVAALDLSYQWQVDEHGGGGWENLDGQTSKTLYLAPADAAFAVGYSYRVVVTATRAGYPGPVEAISKTLTIVP